MVPWEGDLGAILDYFIELSLKYFMMKAFGKKCLFEMVTKECFKAPCLISDHLHSLIMKFFSTSRYLIPSFENGDKIFFSFKKVS